jgi:hypothetical protein
MNKKPIFKMYDYVHIKSKESNPDPAIYKIVGFSSKDQTFQLEADPMVDPLMKMLSSKSCWTKANQLEIASPGHRQWTIADVARLYKEAKR